MTVSARPAQAVPSVEFDPWLIRKLNQLEPCYASFPTEDHFSDDFTQDEYLQAVDGARAMGGRYPLSLSLHIPFCSSLCHFCACNRVIATDRNEVVTYLDHLKLEIDMQGKLFAGMNRVAQLNFVGGGTSSYLSDDQMDGLLAHLQRWFQFAPDHFGEYSIEIDPRTATPAHVRKLRAQGFNCASISVQDFDPEVQKAVNRIQSEGQTLALIDAARRANFRSIGIDLVYGLPKQTLMTVAQTLSKILAANPDRIAIHNYAHLPHIFKSPRRMAESELPSAETRLDMLFLCIKRLIDAGYVYIGMDHFARPTDDFALAQRQGRLHRNFQGYSTHDEADLISFGISAISTVGATYSQNEKALNTYYRRIARNELPIARGIRLTMDDLLRLIIIRTLMCHFELSFSSIELSYPIVFKEYFVHELARLRELEQDGLVKIDDDWLTVTLKGRLLIRNICMIFDRHLNDSRESQQSPKAI
ncbi:MAG TPA: oxygen-independent coproporphyrinogen III oxidase [Burkholderiaceae bacterium]|jgi:oxygen-independent coproporphyrinogen-3 oxidase|nr:oxygen-independent coproporphyrinogen III oxidase [Burkholderiaceae bacterium]